MREVSKQKSFEKQFSLLNKFYTNILKSSRLKLQENEIVDFAINLSNIHESEINNVEAFYIMDLTYKRLYPFLLQDKAKGDVIYFLSYYLMLLNENERAIDLLVKVLDKGNLSDYELKSVTLLTKLLINRGDYENAIKWCDKGLLSTNDKTSCLGIQTNKVNAYLSLKKYNKVIELSKEFENSVANKEGYGAHFYNNLGVAFLKMKQFYIARKYFELGNRHNIDELQKILEGNLNIATSFQEEGNLDKAIFVLNQNIKIIEHKYKDLHTHDVSLLYKTQAKNYYLNKIDSLGNTFTLKAQKMLNFNGKIANFQGSKVQLLEIFADKVSYTNFKNKNLLTTAFQADSLIDLMRQEHTEQGSKLFWREKTHTFYENALETCFKLNDHKNAFYFMEKSRAILLLDALKELDAKKVLSEVQQSKEQDLRYRVIGFQNKLESLSEKDKSYNQVYQNLIDAKEKYNAFIQSLEKSNPAYYRLKYDSKYLTLSELQSKLKEKKQTFVEYFVGDSAVYVMAISAEKAQFKKIDIALYRQLVGSFQKIISQKPIGTKQEMAQYQQAAYQLYQLLFASLGVANGSVIISQDANFIPFAALISKPNSSEFLLKNYAFSYAYSANVLFKNQTKNWHFSHKLLGVSPVDFSKLGMSSLPKSDEYVEHIEKDFFSGKLLLNSEATKQNFIENAPNYSLLQLFTHGKADSTEAGSKIYFYDKVLTLNDLYQMPKLNADLVVLSACQTNLGRNATGEGVMSFARGFAYLNVPSTISTLWSVDNEVTYQITSNFYKYLSEGFDKDIALQKAQLDFLEKNHSVLPYYWSGVVLVGDAEKINSNVFLFWWGGGIILIILLIFGRKYYQKYPQN